MLSTTETNEATYNTVIRNSYVDSVGTEEVLKVPMSNPLLTEVELMLKK